MAEVEEHDHEQKHDHDRARVNQHLHYADELCVEQHENGVAYAKDPSLPAVGVRNGLALLWFIIPRLVPALILAGMIQVVIPQETVGRYFGQQSGLSAIFIASAAGVITPGGPMVSVPLLVVLSNSGMA